ncbi:hypothetical protein [Nocardioides ochotonae]|uniref:hypothetical protein n=1 Tax=Nocardioides ochotonae TaxID=2685869 RepID=UPI0014098438|nr:hypothetical protein [Nocardioides ochotonae]
MKYLVPAGLLAVAALVMVPFAQAENQPAPPRFDLVSPLSAYLGFGYHTDQEDALYEAEESARQEMIADCMAKAGFDFWPKSDEEDLRNVKFLESLESDEQRRYNLAFSGRESTSSGRTAEEMRKVDLDGSGLLEYDERDRLGCLGAAAGALPGVFHVRSVLAAEYEKMDDSIDASAEVADARANWMTCMGDFGYSQKTPAAVSEAVSEGLAAGKISEADLETYEPCNQLVREGYAAGRADAERKFFAEHEETIKKLAVPASAK